MNGALITGATERPIVTPAGARASIRTVVPIAEWRVSADPGEEIITYALGSCLGITVYDPVARVGGLLHVMLPTSSTNPDKAAARPGMFVDTGVPLLFKDCYALGAVKTRMVAKVAGGASQSEGDADRFQIGKRNMLMLKKLLWKNGVMLDAEDVEGNVSRTMSLDIGTGAVRLRINGQDHDL
jgi:chemotaxis protein CheD